MKLLLTSSALLATGALSQPIWNCGTWCVPRPSFISPTAAAVATSPTAAAVALRNTVYNIANADGRFTRLVAALSSTGLAATLLGYGSYTVFAPLDTAFASVPSKFLTPQYSEHLRQVLLYHVVEARVLAGSLTGGLSIQTLNSGNNITVTKPPPGVQLNGFADVVLADVLASNGVIHAIDEVLLPPQVTSSILDLALATPNLSTLASLLSAAGIANMFDDASASFTVFAPTNAAFAKLDPSLVAGLTNPANVQSLRNVLQFHVVGGSVVRSSQLFSGQTLQPGLSVTSIAPVMVNNAGIVAADILASNGVIHLIDTVLIPPAPHPMPAPRPQTMPVRTPFMYTNCGTWCNTSPRASPTATSPTAPANNIVNVAVADGRFTRLVAAVTSAGLAPTLSGTGPFTVFAPLDTAFASVPSKYLTAQYSEHLRQVLLYHVIGGRVLASSLTVGMSIRTLNSANNITVTKPPPGVELNGGVDVVLADVQASNGLIHVINEVLLPSQVTSSILELALATPNLSTLASLLSAAGLANMFGDDSGSFTVFAPTNAAFAKLDPSLVASLTNPANVASLRKVLQFHVIGGSVVRSSQLFVGQTLQTGLSVTSVTPPRVNNAGIVAADILASNGVIHLIDTVLIPPSYGSSYSTIDGGKGSSASYAMKSSFAICSIMLTTITSVWSVVTVQL